MGHESETPFDNIESAQEYLKLLAVAVEESAAGVEVDIAASTDAKRRRDALRLAAYKLDKLQDHIKLSRRILNDLRTLRRLLLDEPSGALVRTFETESNG